MRIVWAVLAGAGMVLGISGLALAQANDDAGFADELWAELVANNLVGPNSIGAVPYQRDGVTHSFNLVQLEMTVTVAGVTGLAIVKRGYRENATRAEILANPAAGVQNVVVMFRREAGYDPDNMDWFWGGYTSTGVVIDDGQTVFAGRPALCIGCHAGAPGGDYVFLHDGIAAR